MAIRGGVVQRVYPASSPPDQLRFEGASKDQQNKTWIYEFKGKYDLINK